MSSRFKKHLFLIFFCALLSPTVVVFASTLEASAPSSSSPNDSTLTTNSSTLNKNAIEPDAGKKPEPYIDGYYPVYPPINPMPGKDPSLVKRGEYLAKMGDCIACHTDVPHQGAAFAGGLAIPSPFGVFHSPNITPDKETGIGNWTEADFIRAMKEGRSPQGQNYFPAFPYIYFSIITEDDARALYAYFMSIPPVKMKNKPHGFPLNVPGARFSLWGWNLLFFFPRADDFIYDPNYSPQWNRGRYIVDGLGHCSMCHTPLNIFGGPKDRFYLTGAFVDGYWAPNITKYGLRSATHSEVANVFTQNQLINRAGTVAGPMAEVNHNSLSYLTNEDRLAIASYLKTVVSEEPYGIAPSEEQPMLKRGKQVYNNSCLICHQDNKMGAPVIGDGASWFTRMKSSGLTGLYRHAINGYNSMPVKGACVTCSDNDIIAAVDYILNESLSRSQWEDITTAGATKYPASGQEIYNENCSICHNEGVQGAPKIGDTAMWQPLLQQNFDVLVEKTLNSEGHPKNGGCRNCTTGEVMEAIKYMISQSDKNGNYSLW